MGASSILIWIYCIVIITGHALKIDVNKYFYEKHKNGKYEYYKHNIVSHMTFYALHRRKHSNDIKSSLYTYAVVRSSIRIINCIIKNL